MFEYFATKYDDEHELMLSEDAVKPFILNTMAKITVAIPSTASVIDIANNPIILPFN